MTGPRRRPRPTCPAETRRVAGFTLVELMVSIALALLLILGINAVFTMSSTTVGSGMQLGEMMRQFRTVQTAFGNDFDTTHFASSTQHPAFIIESYNQPAFRDRNDELAAIQTGYDPTDNNIDNAQAAALNVRDADGNPLYSTLAGWTGIPANVAYPEVINNRNHRVDVMSFFVRNPNGLQRQTPNYPNAVMDTTSNGTTPPPEYQGHYKSTQAWVVYGHVLQPDNSVNAQNMLSFGAGPGGQTQFLGLGLTKDPYTGAVYTSGATPIATNQNQVNPNNFYSSQWVLGRTSILLGDPADLDNFANPYTTINPAAPALEPQTYAKDPAVDKPGYTQPTDPQHVSALRPLSWGASIWGSNNGNPQALTAANATGQAAPQGKAGGIQIQTSQADVAGISLQAMHDKTLAAENPPTAPATYLAQWYLPLISMGYGQPPEAANPQVPGNLKPANWAWTPTINPTQPLGYGPWHTYRFMAQAWPDKLAANGQPMLTANVAGMHQQMAVQTPIFLRGCSQFIVEYAGDYVQQKTTNEDPTHPAGSIIALGEDGQVDFDAVADPTTKDGNNNPTVIKRIRWYGMTRSVDDGVSVEDTNKPMEVFPTGTPGAPPLKPQIVRPLYRYIQQFTGGAAGTLTHMPFEKISGATPGGSTAIYTGFPDGRGGATPQNVDSYTCAWGPLEMNLDQVTINYSNDAGGWAQLFPGVQPLASTVFPSRSLLPWMIRITVRLDDPSGRMPDGQTMQFIYTIPRPH